MEEAGPHSMKKRALKSDNKKKGRQSKADPKSKNFAWIMDGLLMKEQFIMEQEEDIIISFLCSWFYDIKSLHWRNCGSYHLNSK